MIKSDGNSDSSSDQRSLLGENEHPYLTDDEDPIVISSDYNRAQNTSTESPALKIYKRRWYILFVFCSVGFSNYISWNTWDPIQKSAKFVYGWDNGIIALLADWGLISLMLFPPLYAIILKTHGLRMAEIVTVTLMLIGAMLRLHHFEDNTINTILINIGQFLIGAGGIVPMAGASLMSLTWFPESERRTATALAAASQQIGLALSFLLGPLFVKEPKDNIQNTSTSPIYDTSQCLNTTTNFASGEDKELIVEIDNYLWFQFGFTAFLTLIIYIYFPARPNQPPSFLSTSQRHFLGPSLRLIVGETKFWFLALTYGFFSGLFNSYLAVVAVDLASNSAVNFSQSLSGYLGFATTLIGAISGMLVASSADYFRAQNPIRKILLALLITALFTFSFFVLVAKGDNILKFGKSTNIALIFTTIILTGACSASTIPLIFEMGADILYPIPEEVIGSMLVLVQNACGLAILLVFLLPGVGTVWLDYAVLGGIAVAIPMIFLTDDTNHRSATRWFEFTVPVAV